MISGAVPGWACAVLCLVLGMPWMGTGPVAPQLHMHWLDTASEFRKTLAPTVHVLLRWHQWPQLHMCWSDGISGPYCACASQIAPAAPAVYVLVRWHQQPLLRIRRSGGTSGPYCACAGQMEPAAIIAYVLVR